MKFVGIDGCPTGWIVVAWDGAANTSAHYLDALDGLEAVVPHAAVVAIDMPTVIPETAREAERALRRFLGPRRSSVFATPPPAAFAHEDYAAANQAARDATGRGISRQSWALMPKISEVLAWLPIAPCTVIEAHPETSFAVMLGGPAASGKKTWAGMRERLDILEAAGFDLTELDAEAGRAAATDDMLDAAAAAWTAWRFHSGEARRFPAATAFGDTASGDAAIWA